MTPAAIAFMQGDNTPEVLDELRAAMLRWAGQTDEKPKPLNRCHDLGTPRATRIDLRDALLREAAALLSGSRWARCRQLAEMARAFNTRRWPTWRRVGVPGDASAVDVLLFRACELGEPLPESPERFLSVLL
jgi:hypothetical protein